MDKVGQNWKEVDLERMSDADIIEFMRLNCTFSIDVNSKDPITIQWLYDHKHLIKSGNE